MKRERLRSLSKEDKQRLIELNPIVYKAIFPEMDKRRGKKRRRVSGKRRQDRTMSLQKMNMKRLDSKQWFNEFVHGEY